jgi:hypothetical protein
LRSGSARDLRNRVTQRAAETGYFLNRSVGYVALIGRSVRFPWSVGSWSLTADGEQAPAKVAAIVGEIHPDVDPQSLSFVALLTDRDVAEFEEELRERGLLASDRRATAEGSE